MKKRRQHRATAMILIGVALPILANCSMVGYNIGKEIDKYNDRPYRDVGAIKEGKKLRVYLSDGAKSEGVFRGLDTMTVSQYDSVYQNRRDRLKTPQIGEKVEISLSNGELKTLEFINFDYDWQSNHSRGSRNFRGYFIFGKTPGSEGPQKFYLNKIENISLSERGNIDGISLLSYAQNGVFPVKSQMILQNKHEKKIIPLAQATEIRPAKGKAKWIGLGTGIVIDASIVAFVIIGAIAISQMGPWGSISGY